MIELNPQPLGGNQTVFPVVMVQPSHQSVVMRVVFERDKSFTGPIYYRMNWVLDTAPTANHHHGSSNFFPPVVSSLADATIPSCDCTLAYEDYDERHEEGFVPQVMLTVRGLTGGDVLGSDVTVTDSVKATASVTISVDSQRTMGSNEWVSSNASKALEITCLRQR